MGLLLRLRLLLAAALFLAPLIAHAQSANNRAYDSTSGSWVNWPLDHATGLPQTEAVGTTSGTIFTQQKASTTTASALSTASLSSGIVVTASFNNSGTLCVGGSGVTLTTGYCLSPGQSVSFAVNNANMVYEIDTVTTDVLYAAGN